MKTSSALDENGNVSNLIIIYCVLCWKLIPLNTQNILKNVREIL